MKRKNAGALDRFSDLNKQGFMKAAYRKPKNRTVYEIWTEDGMLGQRETKASAETEARRQGGWVKPVKKTGNPCNNPHKTYPHAMAAEKAVDRLHRKGETTAYVGFDVSKKKYIVVRPGKKQNPELYDSIRPGSRVSIVNRFGQVRSGRAVMRGPAGWVLNMGGRYGTPDIATPENVTKVSGGRGRGIGNPVRMVARSKQAAQAFAKRLGLKRYSIRKVR